MKKLFVLSLAAFTGSCLATFWLGLPLVARASGPTPCTAQNGDVNADGKIDLSDPVLILRKIFLQPSLQLPTFCDPPTLVARIQELEAQLATAQADLAVCQSDLARCRGRAGLPDTGQMKCYDNAGSEISCHDSACPGQDGALLQGCALPVRFEDNGDGTVTDSCTGLMWQQTTADINGDGQINGDLGGPDTLMWCDALAYCDGLNFAGHNGWRLPNVRELQSIVDYGRSNPSIDPIFSAVAEAYWSSTTVDLFPNDGWPVGFKLGDIDWDLAKTNGSFLRAVRDAK